MAPTGVEYGIASEVRIGLHEAEATRKGQDYQGAGVHKAARIGALAGAGEIIASELVAAQASSFPVSEARAASQKGSSKPIAIVSIDWLSDQQ